MYAAVLRSGRVVEASTEEEVYAAGRDGDPVVSFGPLDAVREMPEYLAAMTPKAELAAAEAERMVEGVRGHKDERASLEAAREAIDARLREIGGGR